MYLTLSKTRYFLCFTKIKRYFLICSEDVISSTDGVTVYSAHARGQSCVTEAIVVYNSTGEKHMCFQSGYGYTFITLWSYVKDWSHWMPMLCNLNEYCTQKEDFKNFRNK
jgi:hypothetical protein